MYVTGYWPTWAYPMTVEQANWTGMTHAIFFTAAPVQTAPYLNVLVTSSDSLALENNGSDVGMVGRFVAAAHAHGVKALLCIGGIYGTQATNMGYIASDSTRADVFATASVAYAKRRGFDGIDVDWEPPANYNDNMRLLRLLRRELDKGMTYVSKGLLTIACAEGSTSKWDPVWCNQNVDQMNLMMYDFWQLGSGICFSCDADRVGHNAALHRPDASHGTVMYNNQTNYDADEPNSPLGASTIANPKHGPRAYLKAGFSAAHLSAGIPFYGYVFNNVANLGDLRNGSNNDYTTYASIISAMNAGGMTYHWDDAAKVPYLTGTPVSTVYPFNRAKPVVVTYDDTASVRLKVEWAKQLGLGGIMCYDLSMGWVNSASPKDPLLRSVVNTINAGPVVPDSIAPTVSLTAPSAGDSIVAGSGVNITASASDNIGVVRVDFLVNGTVAGSSLSSPYSFNWNTTGLTDSKTLAAKAYDAAGNGTTSASVTVYMKAGVVTVPASPALSSPANAATGQSLAPTLTWSASTGALTYRLQVSTSSSFTGSPVYDDSTLTAVSKLLPALSYSTTYYWHVNAKNSAGTSAWSSARSFTTVDSPPASGGDLPLYQDTLQSPWHDASWAATNTFNSTEQRYSGSYSIKTVDQAWGGLQLWNNGAALDPSKYASLEFAVYVASTSAPLNVFLRNDAGQTGFPTAVRSGMAANQWVTVTIPMSEINPSNISFNYVAIQNYTGNSVTYYIDNLHFNKISTGVPPEGGIPASYSLDQNFPNPFNPTTVIGYSLPAESRVVVRIANLLGQEVKTLVDDVEPAGKRAVTWNATDNAGHRVSSGVYFYRIEATGISGSATSFHEIRKMILLK
jgi:GH18 family chitinase